MGEKRDGSSDDYALLHQSIIKSIWDLQSDMAMCDITFHVGTCPGSKKEIKANSTILSLRSPYFKVNFVAMR